MVQDVAHRPLCSSSPPGNHELESVVSLAPYFRRELKLSRVRWLEQGYHAGPLAPMEPCRSNWERFAGKRNHKNKRQHASGTCCVREPRRTCRHTHPAINSPPCAQEEMGLKEVEGLPRWHSPAARPVCLLSESVLQAEGSTGVNHEPQAGVDGSRSICAAVPRRNEFEGAAADPGYSVSSGDRHGGSTWELVRRQKLHLTRPLGDPWAQEGTGLICSEVSRRAWLLRVYLHTKFRQELPKWRRIQLF